MYRFLVVIERAGKNFSAYSQDIPGCVATGATKEEVEHNMHEALEMHINGLIADDQPVPEQTNIGEYFVFW